MLIVHKFDVRTTLVVWSVKASSAGPLNKAPTHFLGARAKKNTFRKAPRFHLLALIPGGSRGRPLFHPLLCYVIDLLSPLPLSLDRRAPPRRRPPPPPRASSPAATAPRAAPLRSSLSASSLCWPLRLRLRHLFSSPWTAPPRPRRRSSAVASTIAARHAVPACVLSHRSPCH